MATNTGVQKQQQGVAITAMAPEGLQETTFKAFDAISRRAFEIFESNGRLDGHPVEHWLKAEQELFHPVGKADVILLLTELPGSLHQQVSDDPELDWLLCLASTFQACQLRLPSPTSAEECLTKRNLGNHE